MNNKVCEIVVMVWGLLSGVESSLRLWYDMIWCYDTTWYDIWYDMICYDMIYDMIYVMIYDIWYNMIWYMTWYMIYLTATGLTPGGSGTVHIYTQYTEYRNGTYITLKN
jgi:hypothetical protein